MASKVRAQLPEHVGFEGSMQELAAKLGCSASRISELTKEDPRVEKTGKGRVRVLPTEEGKEGHITGRDVDLATRRAVVRARREPGHSSAADGSPLDQLAPEDVIIAGYRVTLKVAVWLPAVEGRAPQDQADEALRLLVTPGVYRELARYRGSVMPSIAEPLPGQFVSLEGRPTPVTNPAPDPDAQTREEPTP